MGLEEAAKALLSLWNAVRLVTVSHVCAYLQLIPNAFKCPCQANRLACLSLTDRCAIILLSIVEEVQAAGPALQHELKSSLTRLVM